MSAFGSLSQSELEVPLAGRMKKSVPAMVSTSSEHRMELEPVGIRRLVPMLLANLAHWHLSSVIALPQMRLYVNLWQRRLTIVCRNRLLRLGLISKLNRVELGSNQLHHLTLLPLLGTFLLQPLN